MRSWRAAERPSPTVRRQVVGWLDPADPATLAALTRLLDDPDPAVAGAACHGLGRVGKAGVPALVGVFDRPRVDLFLAAALALQEVGADAREAVPTLAGRIGAGADADPPAVITFAIAVIDPAHERGVPQLIRHLQAGTTPLARQMAAQGCLTLGPKAKDAAPYLRAALKDRCYNVRVAAAAALRKIDPDAPPVVPSDQP